jgi:hypothetical protein
MPIVHGLVTDLILFRFGLESALRPHLDNRLMLLDNLGIAIGLLISMKPCQSVRLIYKGYTRGLDYVSFFT